MKTSKFKIALDGIIIPFAIYMTVTLVVVAIFQALTKSTDYNLVLLQGISNIFTFIVLCPLYISFKRKYDVKLKPFSFGTCLYMIPLAFSICVIGNVLVDYIPRATENIVTTEVYKLAEEYNIFLTLFIVSVLIPIIEELIFRGFFFDAVKLISNDIIAIVFTSIAFAIAHVDFRQALYALFAGLFLAYIRYKYRRLIYTILLHLLMNLTTIVLVPSILAVKDLRSRLYILFICFGMLFFTIYRINFQKNVS